MISGPTSLATPMHVARVDVKAPPRCSPQSSAPCPEAMIFIGVAAVADYTIANPSATKHKKGDSPLALEFAPTVDILARVAALPEPPFCVGFAAESDNVEQTPKPSASGRTFRCWSPIARRMRWAATTTP
jgi:phosphopantothenoylcysteine decarboxylase/phosphopantothenate--cysteine ligase